MRSSSYTDLAKVTALTKPVYEPGKPIEIVARECGIDPDLILKLASNENPLGPSPLGIEAARRSLRKIHLYPENSALFLREKLAEKRGLHPDQLVIGHGSSEIINLLAETYVDSDTEVVFGQYAFFAFKLATLANGGRCVEVPMPRFSHDLQALSAAVTKATKLLFLPSPNNPTGTMNRGEEIVELIESLPDHVIFCLDEAYAEYVDDPPDLRPLIDAGRKVICLRTFSKIYGLAGLRVGYSYSHPHLAALLNRVRFAFNVNSAAQAAALAALDDDAFVHRSKRTNDAGLIQLENGLRDLGVDFVPSRANFILIRVDNSDKVYDHLESKGVIVRPLKGYSLPHHLRVTVGTDSQNRFFLSTLAECLEG